MEIFHEDGLSHVGGHLCGELFPFWQDLNVGQKTAEVYFPGR